MPGHVCRALALLLGLVLLQVGCDGVVDIAPDPDDDSSPGPADDDDSPGDDDDVSGDDDSGLCDDAEWPDREVEIHDDCLVEDPAGLWDLQVTYAYIEESSCGTIHAGNIVDVNGDGVISTADPRQLWLATSSNPTPERNVLLGHDGTEYAAVTEDMRYSSGTLGEVDPTSPGLEYVATSYFWDLDADRLGLYGPAGVLWEVDLLENTTHFPWLTDLEGDGQLEVLTGRHILDASNGDSLGELEGFPADGPSRTVAADLDLDGEREILAMTVWDPQNVNLYDAQGGYLNTCWTGHWYAASPAWAVGDLDGDPQGEFVVATTGYAVVCDSDGTMIAETQILAASPALVGLVQLDADALPEIVVSDAFAVIALDTDLTELWSYDGTPGEVEWNWQPMSVADLDGDGFHEILIRDMDTLIILDRHGDVVTSLQDHATCSSWIGAPAVVDIDADSLAEIVVPAWPGFAIVENPHGGWLVDGAEEPWPSIDKYPGDRTLSGGIPAPTDVHWADPRTNVWQGLPAAPTDDIGWGDLTGEIADVCPESPDAVVTVYVDNHGWSDVGADCVVQLRSMADGTVLGATSVAAGVPSATGRAAQFTIPESALADGLELLVDATSVVPECDETNNSCTWSAP